ncbi:MAG: hypothetical protein ACXV1K_09635, partial [Kineosporiaceae bacterium]
CPIPGTGPFTEFLARVDAGRAERNPFADDRALGTRARPERVVPATSPAAASRPALASGT